jgi:hypothetical protein
MHQKRMQNAHVCLLQVRLIVTTSSPIAVDDNADKDQCNAASVDGVPVSPDLSGSTDTSDVGVGCFAILKERMGRSMIAECPLFDDLNLLQHLFALHGRTLTDAQYAVLLQAVRRFPRQQIPIVASILAIRLMHWPSYTALPSTFTSSDDQDNTAPAFFDCTSITALCFQLFQDIEARHGRHLVRATLAYVSLARFGVSESELFELLSLSDDVLTEVCVCDFFRHRPSPPPPLLTLLTLQLRVVCAH